MKKEEKCIVNFNYKKYKPIKVKRVSYHRKSGKK